MDPTLLTRGAFALLLATHLCAQTSRPDVAAKLDAGIAGAEATVPVFVRMTDQLLPGAGAYEKFCADHAGSKRSELRPKTIADLQARAERSFAAVRETVDRLQQEDLLRDVARFWIVNGFAADATAAACERLAARPEVGFVYRQRGPAGLVQQGTRRAGRGGGAARREAFELAQRLFAAAGPEPAFSLDGLTIPWNLQRIQADRAWQEQHALGDGVVVAVLDAGIAATPPLVQALWRNPKELQDGEDDDHDGHADDLFGWDFGGDSPFCIGDAAEPHGSMCAGIIAGRPFGEPRTLTGVAPRARLMSLRGGGQLRAYEYALTHGADVLSMSYMWIGIELGNYRGLFRTAHEHLAAAGVLSLGGAGNFARSHPEGRQIATPKDIPCVLAIAGIGEDGKRPAFSSMGPVTWSGVRFFDDHPRSAPLLKPDLSACNSGFPVWGPVAFAKAKTVWKGDDGFGLITGPQGNSFAGPHVAGVAALVWSANPELMPWEVARILADTAKDLGEPGPDTSFGAGLVQAADAVAAARRLAGARGVPRRQ